MKKKIVLILFMVCSSSIFAQKKCVIKGQIIDSTNTIPIVDTSITAYDENDESQGYTFSNKEGFYKLEVPCGKSYELEVENISYKSLLKKIATLKGSKKVNLVMAPSSESISEVIYKAQKPITIKGDTIEYNADSFKSKADETLEDILKKLPGIKVEDNKVYYKGKEIKNITVGGREILGGNNKLLTKNLPSDVIDKVQLNKKFKSNPFANSLDSEDEASLNIELKDNKKSLVFGNFTLGGDSQKHHDLQTKLFYFDQKVDATFIGDANSYGKEVFDRSDYRQFMGGFSDFYYNGGQYSLSNDGQRFNFGGQKLAEMDAKLSALHFGYEPNSKVYMSGFSTFNLSNYRYKSSTERIYNTEDISFIDENNTNQDILASISSFKTTYNPNENQKLTYKLNVNYLENESLQNVDTFNESNTNINHRDTSDENDSFNITQKLSWNKKVRSDDNLNFYITHQYQKNTPNYSINSANIPFSIPGLNPTDGFYNLHQKNKLNNNTFKTLGIYNYLLNNTTNLKFKLGHNYSKQDYTNNLFNFNTAITDTDYQTDTNLNYNESYLDVTLTKKFGELKIDLGASATNYNYKNTNNTVSITTKENAILPHAKISYNITSTKRLNASYDKSYSYPKISNIASGIRIQNYYSLFNGNENLTASKFQNHLLSFSNFNFYKFLNYYISLNYSKRENSIQNTTEFIVDTNTGTINQISQPLNISEPNESCSGSLYFDKKFSRAYSIKINGNLNYNNYNTFIGNDLIKATSKTYNIRLNNRYKFSPDIELNTAINYNNSNYTAAISNQFENWIPTIDLSWAINDRLIFKTDYAYNLNYQNGNEINSFSDLNAQVRYKIFKKAYLKLTAGNLLNNSEEVSSSYNSVTNITQIDKREVLGRYFILGLNYKF